MRNERAPHPVDTAGALRALVHASRIVLVDLDGCLAFALRPHPAAKRFLDAFHDRYVILSNNSTETPESLARLLAAQGLEVDPERIILAGALMVEILAREGAPVTLFASPELTAYARACKVELADEAPIVAFARDTSLTYERLNHALVLLGRGARITISNPDLTHPGTARTPVLETGALVACLRACLPGLEPRVIGKPRPLMFETALRRFFAEPGDAVMIGDNPDTDGVGAAKAGIVPVLVGESHALPGIDALLAH